MNRLAPWWLTWGLTSALAAIFIGERVLVSAGSARLLVTALGGLGVVAATAWRLASFLRAEPGTVRRAERLLLVAYACCLLGAAGWLVVSQDWGDWLVVALSSPAAAERIRDALQIVSTIVLALGLVPVLAAQRAIGATRHATTAVAELQSFRIIGTMANGLLVALALSALGVGCRLTQVHDQTWDLSYFKTARPGGATVGLVNSFAEPIHVLLFFPVGNDVSAKVEGFFTELEAATGKVVIERYDRLVNLDVAQAHEVTADGTVVLVKGSQHMALRLSTNLTAARRRLRTLDADVQAAIMTIARPVRTAYLTVGHGERNDPETRGPLEATRTGGVQALEEMLAALHYKIEPLGLQQGLGSEIPLDAAIVIIAGPRTALRDEELAALDRYLQRGGALLVALDPDGDASLGTLEHRLGLRFVRAPLCDEEAHVVAAGNPSDRRLLATNRFSAHASVTSLARSGDPVVLGTTGSLDEVDVDGARRTIVLRSLPSTFADLDEDNELDASTEKQASYGLIAAVEGMTAIPGTDHPMRAMVFADADLLGDEILRQVAANALLLHDAVQWLGGEEQYAGTTTSEKDVAVSHTKGEDVAWFYATIVGAPPLLIGIGLVATRKRRRPRGKAT